MLKETIAAEALPLKSGWNDRSLRLRLILSIIVLAATMFALTGFLSFVEKRQGVILPDPLLNLFAPIDVTWITFLVIYAGLITAVVLLIKSPQSLLLALQSYSVMVLFRIAAMYLLPLEPPEAMIPLTDPFVEFFSTGETLSKDLFFSGHTSTLFIFFLTAERKYFRLLFLMLTLSVAFCVTIQHVHYTIDVFAAPFFAYAAYRTALRVNRWVKVI